MAERYLSPAKVIKSLGISAKALRHYEQIGLVQPSRTAAGWRVFGPEELNLLYQVKVLKSFGMSLERIGILLRSKPGCAAIAEVLALQAEALTQEHTRVAAAVDLVRRAQAMLDAGHELDLEDLARLSTHAGALDREDLAERLQPYIQRHFTPDDYRRSQQAVSAQWTALITEADQLFRGGADPGGAEARDLILRWRRLVQLFSGGDAEIERKSAAAFEEAMNDPKAAPPIDPDVWGFIKAAAAVTERDTGS